MLLFYIEAALCFIFTLYLYFRYAMKRVRHYIPFLVITVWFLTFVTAVIVPFDIFFVKKIILI